MDTAIDYRAAVRARLTGVRGRCPRPAGMLTQAEIARRAGLPRSTVTNFLAGVQCHINIVEKLVSAVGYRLVAIPVQEDTPSDATEQATSSPASS